MPAPMGTGTEFALASAICNTRASVLPSMDLGAWPSDDGSSARCAHRHFLAKTPMGIMSTAPSAGGVRRPCISLSGYVVGRAGRIRFIMPSCTCCRWSGRTAACRQNSLLAGRPVGILGRLGCRLPQGSGPPDRPNDYEILGADLLRVECQPHTISRLTILIL